MSSNQVTIEAFKTAQEHITIRLELTEDTSYKTYIAVYGCYNTNQSKFKDDLIKAIGTLKETIDKSYVLGNDPEIDVIYKKYEENYNIFKDYLSSDNEDNVIKDDPPEGNVGLGEDNQPEEVERQKECESPGPHEIPESDHPPGPPPSKKECPKFRGG